MPSFDYDDSPGPPLSLRGPAFEASEDVRYSGEKLSDYRIPGRRSTKGSFEATSDRSINGTNGINGRAASRNGGSLTDGAPAFYDERSSIGSYETGGLHEDSHRAANGYTNGILENGTKRPLSQNGYPSSPQHESRPYNMNGTTVSSINGSSAPKASTSNGDTLHKRVSIPPPIPTNPQSTGPLTYNSTLYPASPTLGQESMPQSAQSPHRFSSPPAYRHVSLSNSPSGASTGALSPNVPPPLLHRHTLQVPKVASGRHSRDGTEETVYSSGRFSPTSAPRRGSLTLHRRNTRSLMSDLPHEDVPQDEEALRWAEALRQKRASRRRRRDEEDDDRVVVGTKVDVHHVNWVTAYNMLTGIRFTVSRTNAKMDRSLTNADFNARHKFSFDITGNELTPSAKYDFKFKDYAPWVFRSLRAKFKIDPADYLMSLTSKYILSELGSPGKSGSFFYFSRDYKYIIKTIHHAEHKFLRKVLKDYYQHVENNPNTLLSQFYGLHRVKIPYGRKIHFVVMNNLFPPHRDIHQTFDLKGSTVGRDFREEDLAQNPRATLKDLNWLRRNLHLEFGPQKKEVFVEQMERDVRLLQKLHIMDYSLLVGIHDLEKGNQENLRDKTLQVFQPGGDAPPDEPIAPTNSLLLRTPSKLENARKARELRQIIKQEKPIPMGQSSSRMPDEVEEKREFTFYSDDGGFQATHDDNRPGEEIYYLGIIDCLTHYGGVKFLENFWKGLSHDKHQISPIPPVPYGERFIKFIRGITKTREDAERDQIDQVDQRTSEGTGPGSLDGIGHRRSHSQHMHRSLTGNSVIQAAESQAIVSEERGASEDSVPERTLSTMESPTTEWNAERPSMTLPIVDEAGESSSTGGRSGRSNLTGLHEEKEERPATPMKDEKYLTAHRREMPRKSEEVTRNSFDSNKALPKLPRVAGPQMMNEKESILS